MSTWRGFPPLPFVAAVALSATGPGCETATQLVVHVDTDMDPGAGEVSAFGIEILGDDLEPVHVERSRIELSEEPMPASFGVAPLGGDSSRRVEITISALLGDSGPPMFATLARTTFVEHERSRLDMYLARRCRVEATICEDRGMSCGYLGCTDPDIVLTGDEEAPVYPDWARVPQWTTPLGRGAVDPELHVAVEGDGIFVAGTFTVDVATDDGPIENEGVSAGFVAKLLPQGEVYWVLPLLPVGPGDEVHVHGIAAAGGWAHVTGTFAGSMEIRLPVSDEQGGQVILPATADGSPSGFALSVGHDGDLPRDGEGARVPPYFFGEVGSRVDVSDVAAFADGTMAITGGLLGSAEPFGLAVEHPNGGLFVATGPNHPWICGVPDQSGDSVALGLDGPLHVVFVAGDGSAQLVGMETLDGAYICVIAGQPLEGSRAGLPLRVAAGGREGETAIVVVAGTQTQLPPWLGCGDAGGTHGLVQRVSGGDRWSRGLCSDGADRVVDVAIDAMGTSYVVGHAGGEMTIAGVPGSVHAGPFAAAFDADGNLLWAVSGDELDMSETTSVAYMAATGATVVAGLDDSGNGHVVRSFFPR